MNTKTIKPARGAKTGTATPETIRNELASQTVHFKYHNRLARTVFLAGSFNDWRPEHLPMLSLGDGHWAKDLMLPPGTHEYQFIVDGQWLTDPAAAAVPNSFGGHNSVMVVRLPASISQRLLAVPALIWQRALAAM